jgi:hypothetical protein
MKAPILVALTGLWISTGQAVEVGKPDFGKSAPPVSTAQQNGRADMSGRSESKHS